MAFAGFKRTCLPSDDDPEPEWLRRTSAPFARKRQTPPARHNRYEFTECVPCVQPLRYLADRLPFVRWLVRYNLRWLVADVIAGLTVGLMVVPQALAYAHIARLPLHYGLFSAFMGCFVYAFFGTSKDVTLGPTAILSLLTASITASCGEGDENIDKRATCAVTLTLLSGLIQLALGLLNLGFLVEFIPSPIISGFTSAAAIVIALGQIPHLLGVSASHSIRRHVYFEIYDTCRWITSTKWPDVVLGLGCIALVLFLKYFSVHLGRLLEKRSASPWDSKLVLKLLWIFCIARNAVVILVASVIAYCLTVQPWFDDQLTLTNANHSHLPPFKLPSFSGTQANTTVLSELGFGIVAAPFISFLESIAIAKAFAWKERYRIDPSQELVALGLANTLSSFVQSYPITGSFSRTAVNNQSGVKTPAAGFVTGGVVILALAFLTSFFRFIPTTSLAAIIIAAVLTMVDWRIVRDIFRISVIDLVPLMLSFLLTLIVSIEVGVPVAVGVYLLILLYRSARPRHEVKVCGSAVCIAIRGGWNYPAVEYIWERINGEITSTLDDIDRQKTSLVVIDCSAVQEMDYTVIRVMKERCRGLDKRKISLTLVGCQPHVARMLISSGIREMPHFSLKESMMDAVGEAVFEDSAASLLLHKQVVREPTTTETSGTEYVC